MPEWNALFCLVDGTLVAYALATFKPLATLGESKGCLAFRHYAAAASASSGGGGRTAAAVPANGGGAVAVVLPKRRLLLADWESRGGGGAFRVQCLCMRLSFVCCGVVLTCGCVEGTYVLCARLPTFIPYMPANQTIHSHIPTKQLRRDVTLAVDSPRALCLFSAPGRAGGGGNAGAAVLAFK